MDASEPRADRFIERWRHFVHHHEWAHALMGAVFFAALSVLIEHSVLEWLDIAMLRIVPEVGPRLSPRPDEGPQDHPPLRLLVLTIESTYFDNAFGGRSPIARGPFVELLEEIEKEFFAKTPASNRACAATRTPRALAIDYDLSPNVAAEDDGQTTLNTFLTRFIAGAGRHVDRKSLVLIHHLPDRNEASCEHRIHWELAMQAKGLRFGKPELAHHELLDTVVKYEDRVDSFAHQLVDAAMGSAPRRIDFSCHGREETGGSQAHPVGLKRINFLNAVHHVHVCPLESKAGVAECAKYHGRGHPEKCPRAFDAILLGAGYDERDIFSTPIGQRSGAALHGYAAYSMTDGLHPQPWTAFLIDCIVGTLLGIAMAWIWRHYHGAELTERRIFWAALAFIVIAAVAGGLMVLVPRLMVHRWWLNPGPMVLGIFIDTWINSVTTTRTVSHERRLTVVPILSYALWVTVVVAALGSLALSGHSH